MFKPLALAAALLVSVPAFADVSIKFTGRDAGDPTIATSLGTNSTTGALNYLDATGTSFQAYCVEPLQPFAATSKGFKTYTAGSFTGNTASLLQALYSSSFQSVASGNQQAAFQLAVWEIVSESLPTNLAMAKSTLSVTSGTFSLTSTDATSLAVQTLATSYLTAASNYNGASLYSLTKLTNASYQDLVVATRITTAVPEPESYALFLAGLGAIGMIARRRLPR